MNPVVTHIVSGDVLYSGCFLIALSLLLGRTTKRLWRAVASLAAILGFLLTVLSATPLPLWLYILWGASIGLWLFFQDRLRNATRLIAFATSVPVISLTFTAAILNAPYLRTPRIPLPKTARVYVVGDSLSAHYTSDPAWPERLAAAHGIDIVNLAQPGATVQSALTQIARVDTTNSVLILL
ncbi:MAG: hypothetical protein WCS70_05680, partial [Verrucomicrobiota bacterium]